MCQRNRQRRAPLLLFAQLSDGVDHHARHQGVSGEWHREDLFGGLDPNGKRIHDEKSQN